MYCCWISSFWRSRCCRSDPPCFSPRPVLVVDRLDADMVRPQSSRKVPSVTVAVYRSTSTGFCQRGPTQTKS